MQPPVREVWTEQLGPRILGGYGGGGVRTGADGEQVELEPERHPQRRLPGTAMRLDLVEGVEGAGRLPVSGPNVMAGS